MALSGTLKDFGIADILQLIGHQTKTGRLTLKASEEEVEVFFIDGNVVFASEKARKSKNLLGRLLAPRRAAHAGSARRCAGDAAAHAEAAGRRADRERRCVTRTQLAQMMRLQTTETLYRLFSWKNGSYEFSQEEVDATDAAFDPIRAESILLEGFRRMDEWPALRRRCPGPTPPSRRSRSWTPAICLPSTASRRATARTKAASRPSGTSSSTGWPWAARTSSARRRLPPGRVRGAKALNELIDGATSKRCRLRAAPRRWPAASESSARRWRGRARSSAWR